MTLLNLLFESLDYSEFPLSSLVRAAKQFKSFDEFSNEYSVNINHGYYWHLTDNRNFKVSDSISPIDLSSISDEISDPGSLMMTSDLETWDYHYNSDDQETISDNPARPFAALIDASYLSSSAVRQVNRGFGNEVYVKPLDAKKLVIIGVYPIEQARTIDKKYSDIIPQDEDELYLLWKYANKHRDS